MSDAINKQEKLELLYTLFCDDVRLEAGNKLSFMGVFQNIMVQQMPVSLIKFAVVNHWRGEGNHQHIVASQPTSLQITPGGFADNISFFVNVTFPAPGQYWVQTLVDSNLFDEQQLTVSDGREPAADDSSEAVN